MLLDFSDWTRSRAIGGNRFEGKQGEENTTSKIATLNQVMTKVDTSRDQNGYWGC